MIVSPRAEGLVIARQVDHQVQCGLMATLWGNAEFARPRPWGPIVRAAQWHDEGWRPWEARPRIDSAGRPVDFVDIDRSTHVGLYSNGIATCVRRDPWTGLLVSLHGRGLYERRLGLDGPIPDPGTRPPSVQRFLSEQERLQAELRDALEPDPEWEWAAYRLLQAMDLLSLYLVWRAHPAGREATLAAVPRAAGDAGASIRLRRTGEWSASADPYPFADEEAALPIVVRVVADRSYEDDADLACAMQDAPAITLPYVVHPA